MLTLVCRVIIIGAVMTCIVGLVEKKKVYLAGDSAGVSGLSISARKDTKVFKNGPFVFGFTTSFRMGQILAYDFKPPRPTREDQKDLQKFMVTKFISKVRKVFKDGGYSRVSSNVEDGGLFLVGYKDRLFRIDYDFQVGEPLNPFESVGCGVDLALGALHVLNDFTDYTPQEKLHMALEAACEFSGGVTGPFNFVNT